MRPSLVSRLTLASLLLALVVGGTACKSGVGERCQVNDDCADGLVCVKNTDTCAESIGGDVDGGIDAPLDASEADATDPDATSIDALGVDAPDDAAPDA